MFDPKLLQLVDEQRIIEIASDLMRFKSDNPSTEDPLNTHNETEVGEYIYNFFTSLGISVEKQIAYEKRFNVIATIKGQNPKAPSIAFNGHMDVVPAGDLSLWKKDPYEPYIDNGLLYGRGACDMKGAIACCMHVMELIVKHDLKPQGDVVFTAVIDEEKSNKGINKLLSSSFKVDSCIVGEASDCEIYVGHRGVLAFDIEISGVSCHAAMTAVGQGRNAITDACKAVAVIKELDKELKQNKSLMLGHSQLNVTGFQSGIKVNVIPDKAVLQIDGRTALGENVDDIQALITARLDALKNQNEILDYKIKATTFCPSYELNENNEFLAYAKKDAKLSGNKDTLSVFGATCEASLIAKTGANVIIFGPGSLKQAHNVNEFVETLQLAKAAKFYLTAFMGTED